MATTVLMALTATSQVPTKDENLTDEQIEELLTQAEERLRNSSSKELTQRSKGAAALTKARKADTSGLPKPYVESSGGVAHADARRLVEQSTRTMANGIRKVEDPLTTKKKKLEVRDSPYILSCQR